MRIEEPGNEQEVSALLRDADATGLAVLPQGGGTKLGWGNPPSRADFALSLSRLNRVVEHAWADLTVTVQAGCTIANLQATLAQHGQRLAADPLWPEQATVGGVLSTNDSGALRYYYGGLRDLIIGATLVLADGTVAKSGGKVVKNVAGYDLSKLVTGALGTLGVITQVVFRIHPLPRVSRTLTVLPRGADQMQHLILAVQEARLANQALQVRIADDGKPRVDVLLEATEAGIVSQENKLRQLARPGVVEEAPASVWSARQELWNDSGYIAKFTTLPAAIAKTLAKVKRPSAVVQGTGIGWLRANDPEILRTLRMEIEHEGGSLVILRQPVDTAPIEAWGAPGDTLPIMRALKQRFDPRGTLNPGRFVGGI